MSEGHPLNALPQGHRLQEYELVRVLGVGGFGMTYLGFDHNLDKPVAIKEYLPSEIAIRTGDNSVAPQTSDSRGDFQWGLERFLDEARTLARFKHPNIIQVYRFFEAHGTAYIVMEYAEGETLSAFLTRKGTLTEAELRAILLPLLDGLEVVHEADFLHRDIKPGNIVIRDEDSSPVLLDFGAARQAIGAKSRSVTSIVTPGYAPIEQYSSRKPQGAWTDLYALGGVCYRALTGEVPDDATDRIIDDSLVPVVQRCAGQASPGFLAAIDRALQVDDRRRPQSVVAWRAELAAEGPRTGPEQPVTEPRAPERVDADAPPQPTEPVERPVTEPQANLPEPRHKPAQSKRLAAVIGVVALLVMGGLVIQEQRQEREAERARQAAVEAAQEHEAEKFSLPNGATMAFVWIEPGTFRMGSPASEAGRDDDEGPVHEVEISRGFWLGQYEVTQAQWAAVMGTRPWSGKDYVRANSSNPAVYISWRDVQEFIGRLNAAAGEELYRLPSEAEWEYACRAGTQTRWSFGDDASQLTDYAWYGDNTVGEKYAHAVGTKRPNGWGLYDMHGNVWEWVQDWYDDDYYNRSPRVDPRGPSSGSYRVIRGGGFHGFALRVRSAIRGHFSPAYRGLGIGVRLLRIRNP